MRKQKEPTCAFSFISLLGTHGDCKAFFNGYHEDPGMDPKIKNLDATAIALQSLPIMSGIGDPRPLNPKPSTP